MLIPLSRPTTQQPGQLTLSVQQLAMPFKMFIFLERNRVRKKPRRGRMRARRDARLSRPVLGSSLETLQQ